MPGVAIPGLLDGLQLWMHRTLQAGFLRACCVWQVQRSRLVDGSLTVDHWHPCVGPKYPEAPRRRQGTGKSKKKKQA